VGEVVIRGLCSYFLKIPQVYDLAVARNQQVQVVAIGNLFPISEFDL